MTSPVPDDETTTTSSRDTTAGDDAVAGPGTGGSTPDGRAAYPRTARTTATRARERVSYDRELVHGILDAGYLCHFALVRDGAPVVMPTLYARVGEHLYIHGSTGSRPLHEAGKADPGIRACVTVTHVDGLVLARSGFHHSVNYRSVVAHGLAYQITDPGERVTALDAIVDQVVPGRARDCRPASPKELAATAVVRLDLTEVSAKSRTGGPDDEPEDLALPYWTGVLPVSTSYGAPVPADDLAPGIPVPDYLTAG